MTALLAWAAPALAQVFPGTPTLTCADVNGDTGKRVNFTYRGTAAIEALLDLTPGSAQFLQLVYQPTATHQLEIVNRCDGGVVQVVTAADTCTDRGPTRKQSQACTHHFDPSLKPVGAGELFCDLSASFATVEDTDVLTLRGRCAGPVNLFGFPCQLSVAIGTKDALNTKGCD